MIVLKLLVCSYNSKLMWKAFWALRLNAFNLIGVVNIRKYTILFFRSLGIAHRVSCPHTHQQNGSAERKHRHIVEIGLALLAHAHVPLKFWDEAFLAAAYLINRMPTRVIDNKTPIERLFGTTPNYSMLRIFGCACWPNLRPYNKHKLSFRSKECVFIGYSALHKGYKCLDIDSGRVYISRDVIFDEGVFPFSKQLTQQSQPNLSSPSHDLRMLHLGSGGNFIGNDHVLSVPANPLVTERPVIFPSAQEPYPKLSQLVTDSPEHSGDSSTDMADTSLKSVLGPDVQTESVSRTAEPAGSVALESLPTYVLHPNIPPQQLAGQTPPERVPHATANVDHENMHAPDTTVFINEQIQKNAQATTILLASLCRDEYNKVSGLDNAKQIWDTLKISHEGNDATMITKMELVEGELGRFAMIRGEELTQTYNRLKTLVNKIKSYGSMRWTDHDVVRLMLRSFTVIDPHLVNLIRENPRYTKMTPEEILGNFVSGQMMVKEARYVDDALNGPLPVYEPQTVALKATSNREALPSKVAQVEAAGLNEDEMALIIKRFKTALKGRKEYSNENKAKGKHSCFKCGKTGHFIANCPDNSSD
jgi:hypothetical protein